MVTVGILIAAIPSLSSFFSDYSKLNKKHNKKRDNIKTFTFLLAEEAIFVLALTFLIILYITVPLNSSNISHTESSVYLSITLVALFFLFFGLISLIIFLLSKTWNFKLEFGT